MRASARKCIIWSPLIAPARSFHTSSSVVTSIIPLGLEIPLEIVRFLVARKVVHGSIHPYRDSTMTKGMCIDWHAKVYKIP